MRLAAAIVAAAVAAAGCAAQSRAPQPALAINPYDRVGTRPDVFLTARLAGRLIAEDGCVRVATPRGSVTPLWPDGTMLTGRRIVLPDGRGAVRIGQVGSLGGGSLPDDRSARGDIGTPRCPAPYFAVANAD